MPGSSLDFRNPRKAVLHRFSRFTGQYQMQRVRCIMNSASAACLVRGCTCIRATNPLERAHAAERANAAARAAAPDGSSTNSACASLLPMCRCLSSHRPKRVCATSRSGKRLVCSTGGDACRISKWTVYRVGAQCRHSLSHVMAEGARMRPALATCVHVYMYIDLSIHV